MEEIKPEGLCCLCGEPYERYGNNPAPVCKIEDARCCNTCDQTVVIPYRIMLAMAKR